MTIVSAHESASLAFDTDPYIFKNELKLKKHGSAKAVGKIDASVQFNATDTMYSI